MRILAIDTSSGQGSVALMEDARVLAEESGDSGELSSSGLFRRVGKVLGIAGIKLSDVECFAVAAGPGSFTGLRVGLAAVKGWSEVWQRPIAAVSALKAVAAQATEPGACVVPLLDARRGQLFCGLYRRVSAEGRAAAGGGSGTGADKAADLEKMDEEVIGTPAEILDRVFSAASESPLFVTPSGEAVVEIVAALGDRSARIETVCPALAPVIGRLGYRQALRGDVVDALELNANYIQRCAAELNWKEPA
ncbi:MAG: tRNA (adenosine(37)-N6)-threonylcarbamoyltransferase complex dimerization subunit type 1 TsaB [Candidatus Acidiferrales bacterium]